MQLISAYFLNQKKKKKNQVIFCYTNRDFEQTAMEEDYKKENALPDFSLNLQQKGSWERTQPEEMKTEVSLSSVEQYNKFKILTNFTKILTKEQIKLVTSAPC